MKKFCLSLIWIIISGCTTARPLPPTDFHYKEISTRDFTLASWQKITQPNGVYKFYIEGDGHAFNRNGRPSKDPTPQQHLMQKIAFGDSSPNVIYLARPCQYIKSPICSQRHWTTARFAPEVINSEYQAIHEIAGNHSLILIGFSGGAQIAGLVSTAKPGLNVKKLITIGGNLDHLTWTQHHHLPPLNESLNLEGYRSQYLKIPQTHYVGMQDKVIPPALVRHFIGSKSEVVEVSKASHNQGWEDIYNDIWNEH